jgi:hypothetical protein
VELLNRYLDAVGARLPEAQREDIVGELREELLSRIEERQAEQGRPLTEPEVVAMLKAHGHPLVVAASYVSGQHLISPALLPFYRFAAEVLISVALLVHFVYIVLALTCGEPIGHVLSTALNSMWIVSMHLLGNVTFGALVFDRLGAGRWLAKAWSPRYLPPSRRKRPARLVLVLDVVVVVGLAVWVSGFVPVWKWIAWPVAAHMRLGAIWTVAGAVLLLLALVRLGAHVLEWQFPRFALACRVSKFIQNIGVLSVAVFLLDARPWVHASGLPENVGNASAGALDFTLQLGVWVLAGAAAVALGLEVLRLLRHTRWRIGAPAPVASVIDRASTGGAT